MSKVKWEAEAAREVAEEICAHLRPFCERIEVAGSLRRLRPEVGDVEVIYIPCFQERPDGLFDTIRVNLADEEIERMLQAGIISKRQGEKRGGTIWGTENKLGRHRSGIPVDLFATCELSWWNYLVCRTGPAEMNARIATAALRNGLRWHPYSSGFSRISDGSMISVNSERDVFATVGLLYFEPHER